MQFRKEGNGLLMNYQGERLLIEPWGKNAMRVRATRYQDFTGNNWALEEEVSESGKQAQIVISETGDTAQITNGRLKITVNQSGVLRFFKDDKQFLQEYHRNYDPTVSKESICLKFVGRQYQPIVGGHYALTVKFESNDGEQFFGMGQYQQSYLDLKGCTLELAQRNSQASIPFAVSSLGYGFLWNHPGVGTATFGKNYTEWKADTTREMDYWITVDDQPANIVKNYTEVVGRAPMLPEGLLGLWQCKLRYRTQEEVLSVAREYQRLGIKLDVIIIDFFHWTRQGDWHFDPVYWPDPKAMCEELHGMGTKVVVSVWPNVDRKSENFQELFDRGLLIRTEQGSMQTYDFQGDCISIDVTNPEAQKFLWETCKKNYADLGIDMFWLDNCEPDFGVYDYRNYRYSIGTGLEVSNLYPKMMTKTFFEGQKAMGKEVCNLVRCGWAGSQKYGALLWSGDVNSTFESLRDQVAAGLNMGLAGIPWWNTDIGGFMTEDVDDPAFHELLVRWFEYGIYTPILRMHGDRGPHNIEPLSDLEWGGGYLYTGQSNELWSYGEEVFAVLKKHLERRWEMKPYLEALMKEASETGAPLLRTMFYEFPEDSVCWKLEDQYMFGDKYMVAPVLELGMRERQVYLPEGEWRDVNDAANVIQGGKWITAAAPLEYIPVFERM